MYPEGGAVTGYRLAAESFLASGFGAEAAAAFDRALAAAGPDDPVRAEIEERRRTALELA
jgi:hypothetical protein